MIKVEYGLKVGADFIVGTGTGSISSDDRTVTVIPQVKAEIAGQPLIPGSTIKGLVRWEAAALCGFLDIWTCDGRLGKNRTLCGVNHQGICPVCAIFGSNLYPSALHFSTPEIQSPTSNELKRRAFNAVDPKTGTVEEHKLFFLEMARGGEFKGWIEQYGPLPDPLFHDDRIPRMIDTILRASLGMVRAIGGGKSRGHGSCQFTVDRWPTPDEIKEVGKSWLF